MRIGQQSYQAREKLSGEVSLPVYVVQTFLSVLKYSQRQSHGKKLLRVILRIVSYFALFTNILTVYADNVIWGANANDIYVVDSEGIVSHWDGFMLLPMPAQPIGGLSGIWGFDSDFIYGVGTDVFFWDGTAWQSIYHHKYISFKDIWGSSVNDLIAAGYWVVRWDGTDWSVFDWERNDEPSVMLSCWGSGSDDVFVAGYTRFLPLGFHWDGQHWSECDFYDFTWVNDLWGASANDVYAVGLNSIQHWNGASWTAYRFHQFGDLRAVWGTNSNNVYAVGAGIFHWDGVTWQPIDQAEEQNFVGIWGANADDIYLVDDASLLWHWDGLQLTLKHKYVNQRFYYILSMLDRRPAWKHQFRLDRSCWNPTQENLICDEYIVFDFHGAYYFWPSWSQEVDFNDFSLAPGEARTDIILDFEWPNGTEPEHGLLFWGALCDKTTGSLIAMDWISWMHF